jgi:hypothetical protein
VAGRGRRRWFCTTLVALFALGYGQLVALALNTLTALYLVSKRELYARTDERAST